ncbi:hypothetical protein BH20ACI3_BH20ACI3_40720 [soil metagenome]
MSSRLGGLHLIGGYPQTSAHLKSGRPLLTWLDNLPPLFSRPRKSRLTSGNTGRLTSGNTGRRAADYSEFGID